MKIDAARSILGEYFLGVVDSWVYFNVHSSVLIKLHKAGIRPQKVYSDTGNLIVNEMKFQLETADEYTRV